MQTVIRLKLDELNPSLISSIKSLYKNKEIEIIMHDVKDETEYLKENSSNHKFLLKQIAIVKKNKELKKFTVNEFIKT
jgi:antitoxin YefM